MPKPTPTSPADDVSRMDAISLPELPCRPEGQRLATNGTEIYYEIFGEGDPLLLLSGGAATIESWAAQIPFLSERYRVIAMDSRGHGRSRDAEGPIDFRLMAADAAGLLEHLRLTEVNIVGWSDGGATGLELAMRRPELVRKLVTLGVHSRPEGMTDAFRASVEEATAENFPAILREGYRALSPDGPAHWPVVFEKLRLMWLTQPNFTEEELRRVACPVLLVAGEHDIVRPEESERLAKLLPQATLKILPGASHYSPVEMPEVVNSAIVEFLESR